MDYFTSDLHLSHEFCIKDRGFNSVKEMNSTIFHMFDVVKKGDRVFILGDVSYEPEPALELIKYLIEKKRVQALYIIEGNHDKKYWLHNFTYTHERLFICQSYLLKGNSQYNEIFLSHYQQVLWDKSHYGAYHLYGHQHLHTSDTPMSNTFALTGKKMNVNCEFYNYKLVSRDDVETYMRTKPNNIDHYLVRGNQKQKKLIEKTMTKISRILYKLQNKLNKIGDLKE